MSSESSAPATPGISAANLAAAAERRLRQQSASAAPEIQFSATGPEHELRQKFRRLIQNQIRGRNSDVQAVASLKTLLLLCENLQKDPSNPKYTQFKTTNSIIKRDLMDPKGTVEYCREMGFNPEVVDLQPYYKFNPKKMSCINIGADMLRETLALETEKEARMAQAKKDEKAVANAAAEKVRLAFEDDRKNKLLRDQLERERRQARSEAAARRAASKESSSRQQDDDSEDEEEEEDEDEEMMPGIGHVLGSSSPSTVVSSNKKTD
ncbi:hypothetical protein FB45DRAFT_904018 [Roridomyces roridus]|uniref:PUB domain-containing protein n=1 Tax=Roridomyces roridus TaxID=1738132 RepID=A0AAD7C4P1_9AGAR|nr:hypothetical protein FB45DRAFT_904018 [Roridomyces roridus]